MDELLLMLKTNLRITTNAFDNRLLQLLMTAMAEIKREGADVSPIKIDDANLIVMYAAWLWGQRDGMTAMPRMLRWALNNHVMATQAGGADNGRNY